MIRQDRARPSVTPGSVHADDENLVANAPRQVRKVAPKDQVSTQLDYVGLSCALGSQIQPIYIDCRVTPDGLRPRDVCH
jgi:hypothetical protein